MVLHLPDLDPLKRPVAYDPVELARWDKERNELQSLHERTKSAHDKLFPASQNFERNDREIAEAKLKITEDRIRHEELRPGTPVLRRDRSSQGV